ncbi:protein of unknown function [Shewanella benthica]|uniref:Uncharacterized protein n=1 Tax=Shewanella benthica TaxID=43661 RepID=A0A330M0A7_9GAMM|nr:protein of unknown function [Shewanella benthica]
MVKLNIMSLDETLDSGGHRCSPRLAHDDIGMPPEYLAAFAFAMTKKIKDSGALSLILNAVILVSHIISFADS